MGRRVMWVVVVAIVAYALSALWLDARAFGASLASLSGRAVVAALGLTCLNYAIRWVKWSRLLGAVGVRVGRIESALVFVSGLIMSVSPGKVGEVLKAGLLKESSGVDPSKSAPVVVAERITDLLGLLAIAGAGAWSFGVWRGALAAAAAVIALGVWLLGSARAFGWALGLASRLRAVASRREAIERAHRSMGSLLKGRVLLTASVLSAVSWSMEGGAYYVLLRGLGAPAGLWGCEFVFASATILGALSFLPGGLGVTEGGLVAGSLQLGLVEGRGAALAGAYAVRAATLWFGVALGAVAIVVFRARYGAGADRKAGGG